MYYTEYGGYCPSSDTYMVRISISDSRGGEHYALIPATTGLSYRIRREAAIDMIAESINRGDPPGEVRLN